MILALRNFCFYRSDKIIHSIVTFRSLPVKFVLHRIGAISNALKPKPKPSIKNTVLYFLVTFFLDGVSRRDDRSTVQKKRDDERRILRSHFDSRSPSRNMNASSLTKAQLFRIIKPQIFKFNNYDF